MVQLACRQPRKHCVATIKAHQHKHCNEWWHHPHGDWPANTTDLSKWAKQFDTVLSIHIYDTRLDSHSCQEHVHARVCSALTYSFHQCPGVMPSFIRGMAKRAQLAANTSRDERSPVARYGLCDHILKRFSLHSFLIVNIVAFPTMAPSSRALDTG